MDQLFHLTLYWACDYLTMLGFKLICVSKRGPRRSSNLHCSSELIYLLNYESDYCSLNHDNAVMSSQVLPFIIKITVIIAEMVCQVLRAMLWTLFSIIPIPGPDSNLLELFCSNLTCNEVISTKFFTSRSSGKILVMICGLF